MNAAPVVSVVVSTRNRSHVLGDALSSLLNQQTDGLPYEVIVVDNDSSDDTASLCRRFEQQSDGRLRCLFERRRGVSNGRNTGIAASRGAVVAFTDDDVRVDAQWVASGARRLLEELDVQYVGGPVFPVWKTPPPRWLTRDHWSALAAVDYGTTPFLVPDAHPVCLVTANLFIRRDTLDRVGWFDPHFRRCQDHELMLRLWAAGIAGRYAPDVVARTIVPAERLTRRYHRRWHATHGHFLARMPFREIHTAKGLTLEKPTRGRFFLGAPRFEYRELLLAVARWCACLATARVDRMLSHEFRAWYSLSFIVSAIRARRRVLPSEVRFDPIERRGVPSEARWCVAGSPSFAHCATEGILRVRSRAEDGAPGQN
jgi:glycosyltransferase involved in cell wall biosynthesis